MRPKISWSELRDGSVGLWGLGVEGRANLRKLRSIGVEPTVIVDERPDASTGETVLGLDRGGLTELSSCDVVVKTPGVSRYRPEVQELEARGLPVVGGLGLWLAEADLSRVACITGTKGKSTTTAVVGYLLRQLGYRAMIGGNIGHPPYDPDAGDEFDLWVVETSSYQATDAPVSPEVVAVTSLHPDHLDWHRNDPETYFRDKLSLCSQPGSVLTIAADVPLLRDRAELLGPTIEWITTHAGDPERWTGPLGLLGTHNQANARIARRCMQALGVSEADDDDTLEAAAAGFQELASRLRIVAHHAEVLFIDDSLSTNVLPTLAALDAFATRRVALIAGGHDRGIDYVPLAEGLAARDLETLVLTIPECGPRIDAALRAAAISKVESIPCHDLAEAVTRGFDWARPDGVVLLSPAAPSFGAFRDYRDRARKFVNAAVDLGAELGAGTQQTDRPTTA